MAEFQTGDKAICISDGPWINAMGYAVSGPALNEMCTVTATMPGAGAQWLRLDGFPGIYSSERFRKPEGLNATNTTPNEEIA